MSKSESCNTHMMRVCTNTFPICKHKGYCYDH